MDLFSIENKRIGQSRTYCLKHIKEYIDFILAIQNSKVLVTILSIWTFITIIVFFLRVLDDPLWPKIEVIVNEENRILRIVTVEALSDTGPQMGVKTFRATRIMFILVGCLYIHAMSKIHVRWKK